ncbi:hypothetical protein [Rhodococcus marinonascens]|uniref:hypothetical protein n=1 Tax=Rhodococcus marinonascens TaxID=38311 RepID=UPI0009326677|nr:hypothetical protein [Rhodococcus marinonascens]
MSGIRRYTATLAATVIVFGLVITGETAATADPISDLSAAAVEALRNLGVPIPGQTSLPFPGVRYQDDIAVDHGDVYVIDGRTETVLKLAVGESQPITMPFGDRLPR